MIDEKILIGKIKKWKEEYEYYETPTDVEEVEETTIYQTLEDVLCLIDEIIKNDKEK